MKALPILLIPVGTSLLKNYLSCLSVMNGWNIQGAYEYLRYSYNEDFDEHDPYIQKLLGVNRFLNGYYFDGRRFQVKDGEVNVNASKEIEEIERFLSKNPYGTVRLVAQENCVLSRICALVIKDMYQKNLRYDNENDTVFLAEKNFVSAVDIETVRQKFNAYNKSDEFVDSYISLNCADYLFLSLSAIAREGFSIFMDK